jgi:hypothetical protein
VIGPGQAEASDHTGLLHEGGSRCDQSGTGQAHFTVAPADRVGWYMTVLNDCS